MWRYINGAGNTGHNKFIHSQQCLGKLQLMKCYFRLSTSATVARPQVGNRHLTVYMPIYSTARAVSSAVPLAAIACIMHPQQTLSCCNPGGFCLGGLLPFMSVQVLCQALPPTAHQHHHQYWAQHLPFARSATSWIVSLGLMLFVFSVCRQRINRMSC